MQCLACACHACQCVCLRVRVVALLSALVGWAHLSLKKGQPVVPVASQPYRHPDRIMKIPVYCSLAQLNYKRCLVPCKVFKRLIWGAHACVCTHARRRLGWGLAWLFIASICRAGGYCLPFHTTFVLIDFWLSSSLCLCTCLCLCILICRQGFCFHHTVSAVYGELFASQDVYSVSFLPTALHICCHFITDIYLTLCACQDTLDKSHCYFVCFHTPEWKEKPENGLIFYFQQLFLLVYATAQQVCLLLSIFPVKENQVSVRRCVLGWYSTFIHSAPAIKQKLHLNDSLFPPKATVTGCYLLDLQSTCRLCAYWLTDWRYFSFPLCLSRCLSFCLLTWLPAYMLAYLSVPILEYTENWHSPGDIFFSL